MEDVIDGWAVKKAVPVDKERGSVANQVARLALKYPFKGLVTFQRDTNEYFRYKGDDSLDPIPNNADDWEKVFIIHFTAAAPASTLGVNGDYAIAENGTGLYKKTSGTWAALLSFSGAQILQGAGNPASGLGNVGDAYINQSTGDLFRKTGASTWTFSMNIKGSDALSDKYATTSTDSINLATLGSTLAINIGADLSYTKGQEVIVANSAANYFVGLVDSYNSGTGVLNLASIAVTGTGTFASWDVNLNGAIGRQGKGFAHTEGNITLDVAKITAIEAGSYTPTNPYSASVLNDVRTGIELTATVGIEGNMSGNSISYDGNIWYNNGTWRGPKGDQGAPGVGTAGPPGPQGPVGTLPIEIITIATPVFNLNLTEKKHYIIKQNTSTVINLIGFSQPGSIVTFQKSNISMILAVQSGVSLWEGGFTRNAGQSYVFPGTTYVKSFLVTSVNTLNEI